MILGNWLAMKAIGNISNKIYKRIVAALMIAVSLILIIQNIH
ncbi:MAG: hypothetical protein VZR28_10085 [Candidatus Cryptobacteroides sp.]|jgi:uncharacterized membrane protein YfcA|nr:hypothetical protein [Bacteroidales bacterium]MDY6378621.1 hypothetical protein [Bacteroidales bacterium]MDY6384169.1 hypothetical protein [Bacteroidales bacterium]MEE3391512.1 hypothetical protein [Candidatus Cryptobacteroides sp.]MEE3429368.1 hypothetical protein [Candidatus Cryptobacteroides sp.]